MAKTMDKKDVLYRAAADKFDLAQVQKISGKAANTAIKTAIADAKKAKKAGTMKAPEAKIGMIEGHLFLRLKDGSTHIDDFLIAKNFTAPGTPQMKGSAYKKLVDDYIKTRTDAFNKLVAGEKAVKAKANEIEQILAQVEDMADEAKRGMFGLNNPADRADGKLREAIALAVDAERLFRDECHQPFDEHRNFKSPTGVDPADVEEYSRSFYLSQWRPKYGKAQEYVKLAKTAVAQIRAAAKNARNFADRRDHADANYISMAEELAALAEGERQAATEVWGLQPVDSVARAVTEDASRIRGLAEQANLPEKDREALTTRYLQTSNERMVAMKSSYTRLQKHVAKMGEITKKVSAIPKPQLKLAKVKAALLRVAAAQKELAAYAKTSEGHIKAAGKAFAAVKKVAATV